MSHCSALAPIFAKSWLGDIAPPAVPPWSSPVAESLTPGAESGPEVDPSPPWPVRFFLSKFL